MEVEAWQSCLSSNSAAVLVAGAGPEAGRYPVCDGGWGVFYWFVSLEEMADEFLDVSALAPNWSSIIVIRDPDRLGCHAEKPWKWAGLTSRPEAALPISARSWM